MIEYQNRLFDSWSRDPLGQTTRTPDAIIGDSISKVSNPRDGGQMGWTGGNKANGFLISPQVCVQFTSFDLAAISLLITSKNFGPLRLIRSNYAEPLNCDLISLLKAYGTF